MQGLEKRDQHQVKAVRENVQSVFNQVMFYFTNLDLDFLIGVKIGGKVCAKGETYISQEFSHKL